MRAGNAIIYDTGSGGAQEHHIIPKQIKSHPIITESGFDIESPRNKMMLPTGKAGTYNDEDATIHRGSHPKYTKDVEAELNAMYKEAKRCSPEEKHAMLASFTLKYRQGLLNGDIKLNNAIDHTQDPNSSKPGSPPPSPRGGGGGNNEGPDTGGGGKSGGGGNGGDSSQSPAEKTKAAIRQIADQKAEKKFADDVNQNGLTETWNKGGYGKPIQSKGGFGDIGGVAITGGITDPNHGLAVGMDHTHAIMIPKTAVFGSQPMNDVEMQQLIRELHDAIIVEGTLPFFSLHFNAQHGYTDALYPIIPPQYENTIAGKTLLDLDYAMKGFLNGGLGPNNGFSDTAIDFKKLTQTTFEKLGEPDPGYMSLNELYNETGLQALIESEGVANSVQDFDSKFTISFRILAHVKSIKKVGARLIVEPDFDIEYTIEPHADFAEKIRQADPKYQAALKQLEKACKRMQTQIKTVMPKLPPLDQAFNRLSFMAATTYYFKAIKERGIAPDLSPMPIGEPIQTPKALPALKLRNSKVKAMKLTMKTLITSFPHSIKKAMGAIIWERLMDNSDSPVPEDLKSDINRESKKYFEQSLQSLNHVTPGESRRLAQWFVDEHATKMIDQLANTIKLDVAFQTMIAERTSTRTSDEELIAKQARQYDELVRLVQSAPNSQNLIEALDSWHIPSTDLYALFIDKNGTSTNGRQALKAGLKQSQDALLDQLMPQLSNTDSIFSYLKSSVDTCADKNTLRQAQALKIVMDQLDSVYKEKIQAAIKQYLIQKHPELNQRIEPSLGALGTIDVGVTMAQFIGFSNAQVQRTQSEFNERLRNHVQRQLRSDQTINYSELDKVSDSIINGMKETRAQLQSEVDRQYNQLKAAINEFKTKHNGQAEKIKNVESLLGYNESDFSNRFLTFMGFLGLINNDGSPVACVPESLYPLFDLVKANGLEAKLKKDLLSLQTKIQSGQIFQEIDKTLHYGVRVDDTLIDNQNTQIQLKGGAGMRMHTVALTLDDDAPMDGVNHQIYAQTYGDAIGYTIPLKSGLLGASPNPVLYPSNNQFGDSEYQVLAAIHSNDIKTILNLKPKIQSARVDDDGNTVLHYAAMHGNPGIVDVLLSVMNSDKQPVFSIKTENRQGLSARELLYHSSKIIDDQQPLGARQIGIDQAEFAIFSSNVYANPINEKTISDLFPLYVAIQRGYTDFACQLIQGKYSPISQFFEGLQPSPKLWVMNQLAQYKKQHPNHPNIHWLNANTIGVANADGLQDIQRFLMHQLKIKSVFSPSQSFANLRLNESSKQAILNHIPTVVAGYSPINITQALPDGRQAIHLAAQLGNGPVLAALLTHTPSIVDARLTTHRSNALGETPLLLAVKQGHNDVVNQLLNAGSDRSICLPSGDHAGRVAITHGQHHLLPDLLKPPTPYKFFSHTSNDGLTMLMAAVVQGDPQAIQPIVEVLVNAKMQSQDHAQAVSDIVRIKTPMGDTLFHLAARHGLFQQVHALITGPQDLTEPDQFGVSVFEYLLKYQNTDQIQTVIKTHQISFDPRIMGTALTCTNYPILRQLFQAMDASSPSIAKAYKAHAQVNPIETHRKLLSNDRVAVEIIREFRLIDPSYIQDWLSLAIQSNAQECVAELLSMDSVTITMDQLYEAVETGNIPLLDQLLSHRQCPGDLDGVVNGVTLLGVAARNKRHDVFKHLIRRGANPVAAHDGPPNWAYWVNDEWFINQLDESEQTQIELVLKAIVKSQTDDGVDPTLNPEWLEQARQYCRPSELHQLIHAIQDPEVHIAKTQIIQLIQANREHLNGKDANGKTPLALAIEYGDSVVMDALLEHTPDLCQTVGPSKQNYMQFALLCHAKKPIPHIIYRLLSLPISLAYRDAEGNTVAHYAAMADYLPLLQDADANYAGLRPIHCAALRGKDAAIKVLLAQGVSPDSPIQPSNYPNTSSYTQAGQTALHCAVIAHHPSTIHTVLQAGASRVPIDVSNRTPLDYAIVMNQMDAIESLAHAMDQQDWTESVKTHYFQLAVQKNNIALMDYLIHHQGVNIFGYAPDSSTWLQFAIQHHATHAVIYLLQQGVNPNSGRYGLLPLKLAALVHNTPLTLLLLTLGADPNAVDGSPSALSLAVKPNSENSGWGCVRALLNHGVHTHADTDFTPLDQALATNQTDSIKSLLDHGYEITEKTVKMAQYYSQDSAQLIQQKNQQHTLTQGDTLLHHAIRTQNLTDIQRFMRNQRWINYRNNQGETPVDLVIKHIESPDKETLIQQLVARGANLDLCKQPPWDSPKSPKRLFWLKTLQHDPICFRRVYHHGANQETIKELWGYAPTTDGVDQCLRDKNLAALSILLMTDCPMNLDQKRTIVQQYAYALSVWVGNGTLAESEWASYAQLAIQAGADHVIVDWLDRLPLFKVFNLDTSPIQLSQDLNKKRSVRVEKLFKQIVNKYTAILNRYGDVSNLTSASVLTILNNLAQATEASDNNALIDGAAYYLLDRYGQTCRSDDHRRIKREKLMRGATPLPHAELIRQWINDSVFYDDKKPIYMSHRMRRETNRLLRALTPTRLPSYYADYSRSKQAKAFQQATPISPTPTEWFQNHLGVPASRSPAQPIVLRHFDTTRDRDSEANTAIKELEQTIGHYFTHQIVDRVLPNADSTDWQVLTRLCAQLHHSGRLIGQLRQLPNTQLPLSDMINHLKITQADSKSLSDVVSDFKQSPLVSEAVQNPEKYAEILKEIQAFQRANKTSRLSVSDLKQKIMEEKERLSNASHPAMHERVALIAYLMELVSLWKGYSLYATQVISILAMLDRNAHKGSIAQIRTGEGKSLIVAMVAAIKACEGNSVDIVSSSHDLARRDCESSRYFYELAGLTTAHACDQHPGQSVFSCDIVYGINSDFEFPLLFDDFLGQHNRYKTSNTKREFSVAIIDEADNIFIDKGMSAARIAEPDPESDTEFFRVLMAFVDRYPDEAKLLAAFHQTPTVPEIKLILSDMVWRSIDTDFPRLRDNLDQFVLYLPSAIKARNTLHENHHYIVDTVDGVRQIVMMEVNTGSRQEGLQLGMGGHQCLQIKHDLPITPLSKTVASISHPVFFGKYKELYGVTGTIGSQSERAELKALYNVQTFDVPTHKHNQRTIVNPNIIEDKNASLEAVYSLKHYDRLLASIHEKKKANRPVLILFPTIDQCNRFSDYLNNQNLSHQRLTSTQLVDGDYIVSRAGRPGMVTLATNNAGRGTDIQVSSQALKAGGLHVILTFYPDSQRVYDQAVGRAGRNGQPGSAHMILSSTDPMIVSAMRQGSSPTIQDLDTYRMQTTEVLCQQRLQSAKIESFKGDIMADYLSIRHVIESISDADLAREITQSIRGPVDTSNDHAVFKDLVRLINACQPIPPSVSNTIKLYILHRMKQEWTDIFSQIESLDTDNEMTFRQTSQNLYQAFKDRYIQKNTANPLRECVAIIQQDVWAKTSCAAA